MKKYSSKHENRAHKAVFLAESGKDEVGVGDGQEIALGLGSLGCAFAPDAAGTDGDEGLSESDSQFRGGRCPG